VRPALAAVALEMLADAPLLAQLARAARMVKAAAVSEPPVRPGSSGERAGEGGRPGGGD
jgi:hypothetical protein